MCKYVIFYVKRITILWFFLYVAWEQRKLGDIGKTFTGLSGKTSEDFGHGNGRFVTYMNVFSNPIAKPDAVEPIEIDTKQNEIKHGDVFFTTSSETPEEVGMSSIWLENTPNMYLNSFCFGFRPQLNFDSIYMAYALRADEFRKKIVLLAQGISRYNISKNKVMEISISLPLIEEQQKVGAYFQNIDNLITLHQRKYLLAKTLKTKILSFEKETNTWEQRKLGEMADIIGGGTPSTSIPEYWDGEIDWYAPAEIAGQVFVNSSQRKISKLGYDNSSTKMLPIGTILFTSRAGIGKTAILTKSGCTNQGFQSIVPNKNMLDSYFIFSRTEELKQYGELVGAGSTFVEVSGKQMTDMELNMPKNMKEQLSIAKLYYNLDNLITLHQRKLKVQEFVTYEVIVMPLLIIIANTWEQRKLGSMSNSFSGGTPSVGIKDYYGGDIPFIRSGEINSNATELFITESGLNNSSAKLVNIGDILYALYGATSGEVGCAKLIGAINQAVLAIQVINNYNAEYLMHWLRKSKDCIVETYLQGGQGNLSGAIVKGLLVDTPSYEEQKQIGEFFSNLDNLITLHQRKLFVKEHKKIPVESRKCRCQTTNTWEQRKLGDLGTVSMCKRIFKEQTFEYGDIPFYKIGTFGASADAYISRSLFEEYKSKYPYPQKGDILLSASGSIGRTVEYKGENEYFQDSNIVWLNHNNAVINSFLKHFYSIVIWHGIEGSTIKRLYNENILKTIIALPSIGEQQSISSYFDNLDNLITLHQRIELIYKEIYYEQEYG